jgi:hypothetical protein
VRGGADEKKEICFWMIVGECAPDALRHLRVAGKSKSGALIVCCDDDAG